MDFCPSYHRTSARDSRDRSVDGYAATACAPTSHYMSSSYIYFSWSVECQRKGKGHFKGQCCITPKDTLEKILSFEKIQPGVMAMILFLLPSILFCQLIWLRCGVEQVISLAILFCGEIRVCVWRGSKISLLAHPARTRNNTEILTYL